MEVEEEVVVMGGGGGGGGGRGKAIKHKDSHHNKRARHN